MASFDTLLVANRGEIACRIIRSANALGLRTVAVFSEADRAAPHVRLADEAVLIGAAPPRESYLVVEKILAAASSTGAGAIHPGYGFLSESEALAVATEDAGLIFVGPTIDQLRVFGQKHTARAAATAAGVPLAPGSGLVASADQAIAAAERIGWPVMLKATSGGGGIGMQACHSADELGAAFETVTRVATASFGAGGVFVEALIERARHVEVQLFGDGLGQVVVLGDRDCSLQRRNQKVIEEAPAPALSAATRDELHSSAHALGQAVRYRSAGTVEYVYDADREQAYFLEVNTRLQVEHGVTEAIFGVDLVGWMLRLALGDATFLESVPEPRGSAIEARIYAEDPLIDYRPSSGTITAVTFPEGVRVDTWIEPGTEVSTHYDPLLAKVVVHASDRSQATTSLAAALATTAVAGIETNLPLLRAALEDDTFRSARHTTGTLADVVVADERITVLSPGTLTTVQDWPGRIGYWHVGVPPSGAMDDLSLRLGNVALGNDEGTPGLEAVLEGPTLLFSSPARVCVTGAGANLRVDGQPAPMWEVIAVPAGATLSLGAIDGPGMRTYVLFEGGIAVPEYLGSRSTFTLGLFGGHGGRALRAGDVLRAAPLLRGGGAPNHTPLSPPAIGTEWEIGVHEGPHAAPEFFTAADLDQIYATLWQVHFNSARTGVRLVGPAPQWARTDGGEAGLHPSNIHDTAYALAAIDYTGDTPILLGPDGPSLGGFVCPAVVVASERWKLGQLRPDDTVRFVPLGEDDAELRRHEATGAISLGRAPSPTPLVSRRDPDGGVLRRVPESDRGPIVTYRRQGDEYLLVEFGTMQLDLGLRMRAHALEERLRAEATPGILELTSGIRSLQIHLDADRLSVRKALSLVAGLEAELPASNELEVSSRVVHLPLSWDDPATREAIARYMAGVRDDAPWCPWNIEFIRRVNGLSSVEEVRDIVFAADYLVLGLGDVYLGAPAATPIDPRHRLVTTKYNPARTWTPENAVGIGGAYLCIYGMEGPGGYQFVGRTVQVWGRWRRGSAFAPEVPWLLRNFDRIRWYPVGAEELLELRADMAAGRLDLEIEPSEFRLADHDAFLAAEASSIEEFATTQRAAFSEERARWQAAGEFDRVASLERRAIEVASRPPSEIPAGTLVAAPMTANVWRIDVENGQAIEAGAPVCTLEAMKLEITVRAPHDGIVVAVLVTPGEQVVAGGALVVLSEAAQ